MNTYLQIALYIFGGIVIGILIMIALANAALKDMGFDKFFGDLGNR